MGVGWVLVGFDFFAKTQTFSSYSLIGIDDNNFFDFKDNREET